MKKFNKKGFTLIELLAVIVLLAIVGVVGANIIIKRVNKAKRDTFIQTYKDIIMEFNNKVGLGEDLCVYNYSNKKNELNGKECDIYSFFGISSNDFYLNIQPYNNNSKYVITFYANNSGAYKNIDLSKNKDYSKKVSKDWVAEEVKADSIICGDKLESYAAGTYLDNTNICYGFRTTLNE